MKKGLVNQYIPLLKIELAHLGIMLEDTQLEEMLLIECLMYYSMKYEKRNVVNDLYSLLTNQHKLGRPDIGDRHWKIDNLRAYLYSLSSSENFKRALSRYKRIPINARLYYIEDNVYSQVEEDLCYIERIKHYDKLIHTPVELSMSKINCEKDQNTYMFIRKDIEINVDLTEYQIGKNKLQGMSQKKGGEFKISLEELQYYAGEMDRKIDLLIKQNKNIKRENFKARLADIELLYNMDHEFNNTKEICINEICNIIGMVGAGKSTLMTVLAYAGAIKGYRFCLILDGIKDVLSMNYLFQLLELKSCYVTGESTINDQISKLTDEDQMYLEEAYSSLTAPCILDGTIKSNDSFITLEYGEEPCYSLSEKGSRKQYLCPFYTTCPRKYNERSMVEANVIFTHCDSLIYGKTYFIEDYGKIPFLKYVLNTIDIVMFDEADKLLGKLDQIFSKEIKVKEYLRNNSESNSRIQQRNLGYAKEYLREYTNHYQYIYNCINVIQRLIDFKGCISEISKLKNGKWFTGRILAIDEFKDKEILLEDIASYCDQDKKNKWIEKYEISLFSIGDMQDVLEEIKEEYELSEDELLKYQFILTLIMLEKKVISLSCTIDKIPESELEGVDIIEIARSPFRSIKSMVPTAPLGNIFGYVYDKEEKDLTIFRQFGIGRSIMLDMPYLKLNENGESSGPHTVFFSGTSFAPGSTRYHIAKKVNYIIKSPKEITEFQNKAKVRAPLIQTKVSGSKNKTIALEQLTEEAFCYVEEEIKQNNKVLIIVNSYDQGKTVLRKLKTLLPDQRIAALVSDKEEVLVEGYLKRSDVRKTHELGYQILIAPATVIERGYNIVDENGHSVFNRLFYFVRPMDVPRDIDNIISEINGKIYEMTTKFSGEDLAEEAKQIKKKAFQLWNDKMGYYHSIATMKEEEQLEIVVSRLVLIQQIYGRLLRIRDFTKEAPIIYFIDGAFRGSEKMKFDILNEIEAYLKTNMEDKKNGQIMNLLYGPFYNALEGR